MRDFSLTIFKKLLTELLETGYKFVTFAEYLQEPDKIEKAIILRHDVDKKPLYSLRTAEMENELGIRGTYYFRVVNNKLPSKVIEHLAKLGHEIGYHYETMDSCKGNSEKAWDEFKISLAKLKKLVPVTTICQHGSPRSKWDNGELWKNHNYRDLGILGEPYFDIDFNVVMYLTDTGRRWDGDKVSIRDKVIGDGSRVIGKKEDRRQRKEDSGDKEKGSRGAVCDPPILRLHSTMDILDALENDRLPDKIMLTVHPQRWTDNYFFWLKEFIWQNVKNLIKYFKIMKIKKTKKIK